MIPHLLRASSARRWIHCQGSVAAVAALPREPDSAPAIEGTLAHAAGHAALLLEDYVSPARVDGVPIPSEMQVNITGYLQWFHQYRKLTDVTDYWPERYLRMGEVFPLANGAPSDIGGTGDLTTWHAPHKRVSVVDLKYGRVAVDAVRNEQMTMYALGTIYGPYNLPKPEQVTLIIYQPRVRNTPSIWTQPIAYFDRYRERVIRVVRSITDDPERAPRKAGPWCTDTYCEARKTCATYMAQLWQGSPALAGAEDLL